VMFSDVYVRMVSLGHFTDYNTWGGSAHGAAKVVTESVAISVGL